ncbi:MAG: hypothetical protein AB7N90_16545 [Vicinamibacterales bacterium]
MRRTWMVGIALAAMLGAACGKSESEKQAEAISDAANKAAEQMQKAAEAAGDDPSASMSGFADAMKGMADAMAGGEGKTVDPVSFRDLQAVLPEMSGWTMDKPRGERMTSPIPFSQTEASYDKGDARIDVKIVDSGFNQMLMAPWAMFLGAGYERETDEGYEKAVTIGGNPGFEKWSSESKDGELNIVVAKRFLVTVEGRGIDDMSVLHDAFAKLDTGKLASLGDKP